MTGWGPIDGELLEPQVGQCGSNEPKHRLFEEICRDLCDEA